jgi:hypothetical protein
VETPTCKRCGFDIDTCEYVYTVHHMLRVQATKLTHADDPASARVPVGEEYWVCGACHMPGELILEVVKTGAAEQERLARPPLPAPVFWPREVLSYDRPRWH